MAEARSATAGTEGSMRRTEQLLQWRSSCKRRVLVMVAGDGGGAGDGQSRGDGGERGRQCNPAAELAGSRTRQGAPGG